MRHSSTTVGLSDPQLIRVEVYNPHNFVIFVIRDEAKVPYIKSAAIHPGQKVYRIEPGGHALLPHHYFRIVTETDELVQVLANYGDMIGKRNTRASLPGVTLKG